jgi:hypothetical protein
MKLNYDYHDGKADYRKPDYDKCEYCGKKKIEYCDCDKREKEKCCDDHKFAKCNPKSPCPYPIIFECAQGTSYYVEQTPEADKTNDFHPVSLGCITVDTSCLKMPVVKFDFNTIISARFLDETDDPVVLRFALFKQCDKGPEIECGNWPYTIELPNGHELTSTFSFSHCECNSCPGCCNYSVKLIKVINDNRRTVVNVYCPTLSVIAKSGC